VHLVPSHKSAVHDANVAESRTIRVDASPRGGASTGEDAARLTVARRVTMTRTLGPGRRAVVWFHGCSLRCPGCIAEEMNRSAVAETWSPSELADWVAAIPGIEGVTLSGGDPFDQPIQMLAEFVRRVRTTTALSVMCYTGRTLEQLHGAPRRDAILGVLNYVDLLVDGPYIEALDDGALWRGSSNQRFHFLSPRYLKLRDSLEGRRGRPMEIRLSETDDVEITGIPPRGAMEAIRRAVESCDVDLTTADELRSAQR
jgi:anaerobic ribonucleoside-triphosphate reductase activating protein